MTIIANIWAYFDLIKTHIDGLSVGFPIYAWKPLWEVTWVNWYFYLIQNQPAVEDDSTGVLEKEAIIEFVIISGDKATPDVVLYEDLDALSNLIVTEAGDKIELPWGFIIYSIQEMWQSGILSDTKERSYVAAQYIFRYKSRYAATPRLP